MTIIQTRRITLSRTHNTLTLSGRNNSHTITCTSAVEADNAQARIATYITNNPSRGINNPYTVAAVTSVTHRASAGW